uniref:Uncharacterized protein n=1 Tax=Anopheles culicifacies TaxID=139723 RepID=A0A182MVA4_9DIPT
MEYASFVRDLRKKSQNNFACPPDTQYAKEFEDQMQALVTNFDINDSMRNSQQQQQHAITSTPLGSGSGSNWKTSKKAKVHDTTEQMEVPKKKMALDIAQKMNDDQEWPGSFDSSEGISMCFDSCSSNDGTSDLVAWNEITVDPSASGNMPAREAKIQQHPHNSFPFEAIQGEDSLLEPSADNSHNDREMFTTKPLCTPAKRTYDEANS